MNTDDILFEEMNPWKDSYATAPLHRYPSPIGGRYASLYDELKKKCNPLEYMSPYNYEKVKIANELASLTENNKNNPEELKSIRKRAMKELNLQFATIGLYEELTYTFNPKRYANNPTQLTLINEIYHNVLLNADNIEALELIEQRDKEVCRKEGITLVDKKEEERKRERKKREEERKEEERKEEEYFLRLLLFLGLAIALFLLIISIIS